MQVLWNIKAWSMHKVYFSPFIPALTFFIEQYLSDDIFALDKTEKEELFKFEAFNNKAKKYSLNAFRDLLKTSYDKKHRYS